MCVRVRDVYLSVSDDDGMVVVASYEGHIEKMGNAITTCASY